MSEARVAVLQVVSKQLSVTAAAAEYGISRRHLHRLLLRYREGGLDALQPRSRRPKSTPIATTEAVRARAIELRVQLTADGLDAGPVTIAWHLEREGHKPPAPATISRILKHAGLISPQPRKRPRSSYTRFEMAQPNEMWQSDFIHWRLADGTDVEILNWLDDHSRYLLSCTAHQPVTGDHVASTFLAAVDDHGAPASTLTDNGRVYTARFGGGRNAFEYLLPIVGVRQKNGSPGHPQTRPRARRRHPGHRRRPHHRRSPLSPSHPARQELLAQPKQRARPLAELLRPHSRLIRDTCHDSSQNGGGGIRTLETLARLTVFETARFNHSRTSPTSRL